MTHRFLAESKHVLKISPQVPRRHFPPSGGSSPGSARNPGSQDHIPQHRRLLFRIFLFLQGFPADFFFSMIFLYQDISEYPITCFVCQHHSENPCAPYLPALSRQRDSLLLSSVAPLSCLISRTDRCVALQAINEGINEDY